MKNNVIGSRRTVMNSLNRIAFRPRKGACFISRAPRRAKLQAPSSKLQRNSKHQTVEKHAPRFWSLVFGPSLELDVWSLELLPSRRFLLLVLAPVFRRERHKNVLKRRSYFMNLRTSDSHSP